MNTAHISGRRAARIGRPDETTGTQDGMGGLPGEGRFAGPEAGPCPDASGTDGAAADQVVSGEGQRVGLVTSDSALRELVAGICASAGASLRVAAADTSLRGIDIQLCDVQALADGRVPHGRSGREVVLLGRAEDTGLWDAAALLGGCPVAVLPEAESWLADRLAPRPAPGEGSPAVVIGVAGAVGGIGTSTLACWLAADAAARGVQSVLVDGDPDACGLDLLLGLESLEALRWPDLYGSKGVLRPEQLWPLLPGHAETANLRWLSWGRDLPSQDQVPGNAVVTALRGAVEAVVVDLGRIRAGGTALANQCDIVVVAMPRTVRGVLAAHRATSLLGSTPVEYVLCGVDVADVDGALVAETLGREPVGHLRFDGRVPEATEIGRLLDRGARRRHARAVGRMWDELNDIVRSAAAGAREGEHS